MTKIRPNKSCNKKPDVVEDEKAEKNVITSKQLSYLNLIISSLSKHTKWVSITSQSSLKYRHISHSSHVDFSIFLYFHTMTTHSSHYTQAKATSL